MSDVDGAFYLSGELAGRPLRADVTAAGLEIGREPGRGLTVVDPEVSRLHCVVRVADGKVTVEDRSRNGTLVNGTKIAGSAEIRPGDVLQLGAVRLTLREGGGETRVAAPAATAATDAPPTPPPAEAAVLAPGDVVDRYRIDRLIGKGGMGTVYAVTHTGLDLPRALKALTLPDDPAYASFREKFLDEGKILARLKHDNITQVYDAAYDEKTRTLFFVMDLVLYDDGKPCTLADVAYDECDVSNWFASLASALDYIHAQGIVHSDIKLQNVLVSPGQKIKLADFGVAHLLSGKMRSSLREDDAGSPETIGYTAHYVAPEVLLPGGLPSIASDVYALGVLLVRLLTNKWYDEHPTALAEIAAKRALNWRPVLAQMLAADPKRRATNLMKLVTELRRGSKTAVRRKYQVELRRRRSQNVRLQRAVNIKTGGILSTAVTPEARGSRALRWAIGAGVAVLLGVCFLVIHQANSAREQAAADREERLEEARGRAAGTLRTACDKMQERERKIAVELGARGREYAFVSDLSRANATGSTDRATAELRNEVLVRYADVLRSAEGVRGALADFRRACSGFEDEIPRCREPGDVERITGSFKAQYREKESALDAVCEGAGRKWSAYGEAKERLAASDAVRHLILEQRRTTVDFVRQTLESVAELKASSAWAKAKEKLGEGDRLVLEGPSRYASASNCYAAACAILSGAREDLQRESQELGEIEKSFQAFDERLRRVELGKFRQGQSTLVQFANHAKSASISFSDRWKEGCRFESHTGLVETCSLRLQAPAVYLVYLTKALQGSYGGLGFALTETGVNVSNRRFTYGFRWSEVFSGKRQDTKSKERYVQRIVEILNVPANSKCGPKLLVGRWILLKELMPSCNDEEQATRLADVIRADGSSALLAWARQELPAKFPAQVTPSAPPEEKPDEKPEEEAEEKSEEESGDQSDEKSEEESDGESEEKAEEKPVDEFAMPEAEADVSQVRLMFFSPATGLAVPAVGSENVEISRCLRIKESSQVRFQMREGEIAAAGGARHSYADVGEGQSFDVRYEDLTGLCRFTLVAWIDHALGRDQPLVLVRCRYLPDTKQ